MAEHNELRELYHKEPLPTVKTKDIRLRVEEEIKKEFTKMLKDEGDTPSSFLRMAIKKYMNERSRDGWTEK